MLVTTGTDTAAEVGYCNVIVNPRENELCCFNSEHVLPLIGFGRLRRRKRQSAPRRWWRGRWRRWRNAVDTRKHVLKGVIVKKRIIHPALIVAAILLGLVIVPQRNSAGHGLDGYEWLSWSNDSRQLYLLSFLHAYRLGFSEACVAANDVGKLQWTIKEINACEEKQMSFSSDLPDLNKAVTEFYREYPDDRALALDVLLRQFSDQKHRSAKEIHALLEAKEPL